MSVVWHSIPLRPSQLSLAHVLKSGQSFRWTHTPLDLPSSSSSLSPPASTEYSLCLPDRLILLRQSRTHLHYSAVFPPPQEEAGSGKEEETERWVRDYLRLDVDLEELYRTWGEKDMVFRKEEGEGGVLEGVAVLRQDPWECLFSFICSSNNNIPRITSMVQSAARHFSPPLLSYPSSSSIASSSTPTPTTYHPFPPPSAFSSPSVIPILRDLGFGYRAPFIQRTAAMLVEEHLEPEEWLRELRGWETGKAREELLRFLGVGRKVADCVLLMSMDKNDIIPIDVHVHQIAQRLYNFRPSSAALPGGKRKASSSGEKIPMTPKLYEEVQNALSERWGAWGGWTQAVLFASDLPFLLSSLAPNSTKPLKQPLIRSSQLSSSLPEGLVALPESMLPSSPPPETKPAAVKVEGGGSGRLGFPSSKKSSSTKKVKNGTEIVVVVKEEVGMESGLGLGVGEEEGEGVGGGSLGERIKRRKRNASTAVAGGSSSKP